MSIITKGIDELYPDDGWYEFILEEAVEDLATRGIIIEEEVHAGRLKEYRTPAISFSGFWSQGDGLAFDCEIDWATYCATNTAFAEQMPAWYLLLVANPHYIVGGTKRSTRSNSMSIYLGFSSYYEDDTPEHGFFAGVESITANGFDFEALEKWIIEDCQAEAQALYRRLEKGYEEECKYLKEQRIEDLKEEHADVIAEAVALLPEEHDDVDFEDLEVLGYGVARRGEFISQEKIS